MDVVEITNSYEDILGENERILIQKAKTFVKSPLPHTEADCRAYAQHNLQLQEDLNNLQTNVDHYKNRKMSELRKREAKVRDNAYGDGVKSKEERDTYCHKDSAWDELNSIYANLTLISSRLNSLQWVLKSGLTFLSR
jgi:hypothetical protein